VLAKFATPRNPRVGATSALVIVSAVCAEQFSKSLQNEDCAAIAIQHAVMFG
jgi:Holliday junction resolvasome RuvABC DNA-binding subunit